MKLSGRIRFRIGSGWLGEYVILQVQEFKEEQEFIKNREIFAKWRDAKPEDIVELTQLGLFTATTLPIKEGGR